MHRPQLIAAHLGVLLSLAACGKVAQASIIITVPGTTSIWLSGQPNGTTIYQNTAPPNSPVLVDLASLGNPDWLVFNVTGSTSRGPDLIGYPLVGGDGETPGTGPNADQAWSMPPVFGLSGFTGPYSALVGVFLSPGPLGPVPPSLSFGTPQERAFTDLSPLLQQVFFIGDGLTGVGFGSIQTFHVPPGADRLYLATYDSISWDNVGALRIEIRTQADLNSTVPEPASVVVLGIGLLSAVCGPLRHRVSVARGRTIRCT